MLKKHFNHFIKYTALTGILISLSSGSLFAQTSNDAGVGEPEPLPVAQSVEEYFAMSDHFIAFRAGFDANENVAINVTDQVSLYVDFQDPRMPLGVSVLQDDNSITIHPNTFTGAAILVDDPEAANPVNISAAEIGLVTSDTTEFRQLCAFDDQRGGKAVAGTVMATLSDGDIVSLPAEVGQTETSFSRIQDATIAGGPVISWPSAFCRGVKSGAGSCLPRECSLSLVDMKKLAGKLGLEIPADIIAEGIGAVTDWLAERGVGVSGNCGEVQLIFPPIPLGCQCIYVQF